MIAAAHVDGRVLAFAVATTLLSVVGFGLAPALREAQADGYTAIRGGIRSVTAGPATGVVRRGLVAAQVALALVILAGAGLLGRTLVKLERVPLGFDADHLLLFRQDILVPASPARDTSAAWQAHWWDVLNDLAARLPATPGLGSMTSTMWRPFSGEGSLALYTLDGHVPAAAERTPQTYWDNALDDYFGTMGIPVLEGRTFTRQDDRSAPPVVAVSESFARHAWPGQDALGHRIRFVADTVERWWTVVGVVGDTRYDDPAAPVRPTVYVPTRQGPYNDPWYVVHTRGDPAQMMGLVERDIEAADPRFGLSRGVAAPMLLRARLARPRALAYVFAALAGTALLLTAVGLFGVLSAYVRERQKEIAVRSALGASPSKLRGLVLGQVLGVAVAGVAFGAPLALSGSYVLRASVPDVQPMNALTIVVVAIALIVVVGVATYWPMTRVARVDVRTILASE